MANTGLEVFENACRTKRSITPTAPAAVVPGNIYGFEIPPGYAEIGERTLKALIKYELYGELDGGFLHALVANDLRRAICNAESDQPREHPAHLLVAR